MLPSTWFNLRPHAQQSELWRCPERFVTVDAGRGSGKTLLARRRCAYMLCVRKEWPDPMYFYAMPTYKQAKRVVWDKLVSLIPKEWLDGSPNQSDMCIKTIFGSRLFVVGMDKPARIEGDQWDGGVVDESCDQKPGSFSRSILPALSHRMGWCWRIGVPKRFGPGADEFRKCCEDDAWAHFNWPSEDILTPEQIDWAKRNLDPIDYDEQFRANWHAAGGLVFHSFDYNLNVSREAEYDPGLPILVGSDFNVDPMCWVLAQEHGKYLDVFGELFQRDCNTQRALDILQLVHGKHAEGWTFYGDATGQARKTSASESDYLIIKNDDRFKPRRVLYPKSNPPRRDRFASTNAMLCNAAGERQLRVHPKCRHVIADLQARTHENDGGDIGHMTDALGYVVWKRNPIRRKIPEGASTGVSIYA